MMFIDADITRTGFASRGFWLRTLPEYSMMLNGIQLDRINATSEDAVQEFIDRHMMKESDEKFSLDDGEQPTSENTVLVPHSRRDYLEMVTSAGNRPILILWGLEDC